MYIVVLYPNQGTDQQTLKMEEGFKEMGTGNVLMKLRKEHSHSCCKGRQNHLNTRGTGGWLFLLVNICIS